MLAEEKRKIIQKKSKNGIDQNEKHSHPLDNSNWK
jgi:ribosome maturation protein Sdo1